MKSLCIKTTNKKIIDYSDSYFKSIIFNTIYYTTRTFKNYYNFIIHYIPNTSKVKKSFCLNSFYDLVSNYIYDIIINFYEEKIIKSTLNTLYFYFDEFEKEIIINNCILSLQSVENEKIKKDLLIICINNYISETKAIYLDGFVNFRMQSYIEFINKILSDCINDFIIQKEYYEYINLLKKYINSQTLNDSIIHVIYISSDTILLDENLEIISIANNNRNKIFSDISFDSNDYVLNTLLSLLPNTIYIHLLADEDLFIDTLKLIFENHIHICKSCTICEAYSFLNNSYTKQ